MTTSSGISASMASIIAAFVKAAGTKAIDTSAPVFSIASATVPKTGSSTSAPSLSWWSTVVPALRALTPPTTWVPAFSMSAVCFVPSPPVMPWTMTLESLLRKIDISLQFLLRVRGSGVGERGGLVGALVHRGGESDERVIGLLEDPAALLDPVAVDADDERLRGGRAELGERADDALGDGVARGDAAEDVDEDRLDLRVAEDDVQARRHDLGGRTAADVEEVGGLHAAVVLAGVRDDVERRHDQARAVADDADLAVELDVVEVVLLGLRLERVGRRLVLELGVLRVAEAGVLVGLRRVDADRRVDRDLRERLGALDRELLDLHAALDARHREVGAVGPVEQHREVVLLGDARARGDHHAVDRVALDVHAEDLGRLLRGRAGLLGGRRDDPAQHGHAVLLEDVARLVFEQVHPAASFRLMRRERHDRCLDIKTSPYRVALAGEGSYPGRVHTVRPAVFRWSRAPRRGGRAQDVTGTSSNRTGELPVAPGTVPSGTSTTTLSPPGSGHTTVTWTVVPASSEPTVVSASGLRTVSV